MSVGLELTLERPTFAPGEMVTGSVYVREGGRSRSLQVLLNYGERTADYTEIAWQTGTGPLHQGPLMSGSSFPFSLPLPADALPGYACSFGELFWEVHAHSDEFGFDSHAQLRIDMRPDAAAPGAAPAPGAPPPPPLSDQSAWGSDQQYGGVWDDKDAWGS